MMDNVKETVISILNDLTGEDFSDNLDETCTTVRCLTQWERFSCCWSFKINWGLMRRFPNLTVMNGIHRQK